MSEREKWLCTMDMVAKYFYHQEVLRFKKVSSFKYLPFYINVSQLIRSVLVRASFPRQEGQEVELHALSLPRPLLSSSYLFG